MVKTYAEFVKGIEAVAPHELWRSYKQRNAGAGIVNGTNLFGIWLKKTADVCLSLDIYPKFARNLTFESRKTPKVGTDDSTKFWMHEPQALEHLQGGLGS